MNNFEFMNPAKIIFGQATHKDVGQYVKEYSNRILLHYGGNTIKRLTVYDDIVRSLKERNIEYFELGGVVPNPRLSLVKEGIDLCKSEGINFVLAVGGGSVIDSAKAIALGSSYEGDVWDFFTNKAVPESAIDVGTILTIPGSGSEMSESSIITSEEGSHKRGCDSKYIIPKFSILNPEMCYTIPSYYMACGLADIFSHLMERYFTSTENVDLSDRLIEGAMKSLIKSAYDIQADPKNYNYCAEVMWTATMAHNGMLDVGRNSDWSSHRIEHEISAIYDITHGAGMAIVSLAWMRYVRSHNIARFTQFAHRVFNVQLDGRTEDEIALEGIDKLETFFKDLGLKTTLSDAGIPSDRFEEMTDKTLAYSKKIGCFKELYKEDIINILKMAAG